MSKKEIEIYNTIPFPSDGKRCGIVINDGKSYKCPNNNFCNFKQGLCEKIECVPYNNYNITDLDISKYDGHDVSRKGDKDDEYCNYPISKDEMCGFDNNSNKCLEKQCCSNKGKCGNDRETCLSTSKIYPEYIKNMYNPEINLNREIYSNPINTEEYEKTAVRDIAEQYLQNNNFEKTNNGRCIDIKNKRILKCSDKECCTQYGDCTKEYNYCNKSNRFNFSNYGYDEKDLNSNLLNGDNFDLEYRKWLSKKTENYKNIDAFSDDTCIDKRCINNKCCMNGKCKYGEICKFAKPNVNDGLLDENKKPKLATGAIVAIVIVVLVIIVISIGLIYYFIIYKKRNVTTAEISTPPSKPPPSKPPPTLITQPLTQPLTQPPLTLITQPQVTQPLVTSLPTTSSTSSTSLTPSLKRSNTIG